MMIYTYPYGILLCIAELIYPGRTDLFFRETDEEWIRKRGEGALREGDRGKTVADM